MRIDRIVAEKLRAAGTCAVIAHVAPDGDTLGSALALALALEGLGVRADVYCQDEVPKMYRLLPGWERVKAPPAEAIAYPVAVSVDVSDEGRLGSCAALFHAAGERIVIDHHKTNPLFGDVNMVLEGAATAELMLDVLDALEAPLTREIADNLFVALSTDTGNFSYANTTGRALRAAARLAEAGADIAELTRAVYRVRSPQKTRLIGRAIAGMRLEAGGRIGLICLSEEDFALSGAMDEDTEGIVNYASECEGVQIAILARPSGKGVKLSLRSTGGADVGALAGTLGGGGHAAAAGVTLPCGMDEAVERILDAARGAIGL